MTSHPDNNSPKDANGNAPVSPPKKRRKPLSKVERQLADLRTAKRLSDAGREPYRHSVRVFEDIEVEPGRKFASSPYRERWIFAGEGGRRAARISAEFDLFKQTHDLSNVRHFGFRPSPSAKGDEARVAAKAEIGQLREEMKRFADEYDKWISKLVHEGLIEPLLTFIHVRFDKTLFKWDVHAHCIWIVKDMDFDEVFLRVAAKFSKPWRDDQPIRNVGALVNYAGQWVVDYREQGRWPEAALLEFWDLKAPRLVRAAGEFAKFRRELDGRALRRVGDQIAIEEKTPARRYNGTYHGAERAGVVGYARLKLDGRKRLCAIWSKEPQGAEPPIPAGRPFEHKVSGDSALLTSRLPGNVIEDLEEKYRRYPTASTGLTPPPLVNTHLSVSDHPLAPPSRAWWWKAWPHGAAVVRHCRRGACRPVARRLAKLAAASSSKRLPTRGGSPAGRWWATEAIIRASGAARSLRRNVEARSRAAPLEHCCVKREDSASLRRPRTVASIGYTPGDGLGETLIASR